READGEGVGDLEIQKLHDVRSLGWAGRRGNCSRRQGTRRLNNGFGWKRAHSTARAAPRTALWRMLRPSQVLLVVDQVSFIHTLQLVPHGLRHLGQASLAWLRCSFAP